MADKSLLMRIYKK